MRARAIALTGHRPDRLGGYGPNPVADWAYRTTTEVLKNLRERGYEEVLSGMALGYDQLGARAALEVGLRLVAVVPFAGQEEVWPPAAREAYRELLSRAAEVVIVADLAGSKDRKKAVAVAMEMRNRVLVESAALVLACWDGRPGGGTWQALQWARQVGRPVVILRVDRQKVYWPQGGPEALAVHRETVTTLKQ